MAPKPRADSSSQVQRQGVLQRDHLAAPPSMPSPPPPRQAGRGKHGFAAHTTLAQSCGWASVSRFRNLPPTDPISKKRNRSEHIPADTMGGSRVAHAIAKQRWRPRVGSTHPSITDAAQVYPSRVTSTHFGNRHKLDTPVNSETFHSPALPGFTVVFQRL